MGNPGYTSADLSMISRAKNYAFQCTNPKKHPIHI